MLNIISAKMPKINPDIANGIAMKFMGECESYIDRDLRVSCEQLPDGLEYLGYEVCTPKEEYLEIMRRREKLTVELSRSDMYMCRYKRRYMGENLPDHYMYLPFCGDAGIMYIRGTQYSINPVIADVAISVTPEGLFVPLSMAKAQFERFTWHFRANGETRSATVVHSHIYRRSKTSKALPLGKNSVRSTMLHYILCKYGFTETMHKFFGVAPENLIVGTVDTVRNQIREKEGFPQLELLEGETEQQAMRRLKIDYLDDDAFDKWVICRTCYSGGNAKPAAYKGRGYMPTKIAVAMRRDVFDGPNGPVLADAMGSLFYVMDVMPERVRHEYFDNPQMWQSLLGIVLFGTGSNTNEGERQNLVAAHMDSLDGYINYQSKRYLAQDGVEVDNLYELFAYVVHMLPSLVLNANTTVASLYKKRLMVTRYILSDISFSIYRLMFKLRARILKKGRLSVKEVLDGLRKGLARDTIASITSRHAEVTPVSSPGDNKIFKITSNMILQENTDTSKARGGGSLNDPSKFLHTSIIVVGSFAAMGKNEPTGRGKINVMLQLSPRGDVLENQEHKELLDHIQHMIKR
jgi:hypothetical protein